MQYYRVSDVATMLQVSDRTIKRWILEGKIPGIKPGREWRIPRAEFDVLLQGWRQTVLPQGLDASEA
jgi:excisionase family DNA binding protein